MTRCERRLVGWPLPLVDGQFPCRERDILGGKRAPPAPSWTVRGEPLELATLLRAPQC
jgi:hypothetical protein